MLPCLDLANGLEVSAVGVGQQKQIDACGIFIRFKIGRFRINLGQTKCHMTKCHRTNCHADKMSRGQNVTAQKATRTKCRPDKIMRPGGEEF